MNLRPYQLQLADFIIENHRCNVHAPMGLGKTVTVLTALDALTLAEDAFPVLVVAPVRVAKTTWPDEIAKWAHTRHFKVSVICGKPTTRVFALSAKADIYTINYENLEWLVEQLELRGKGMPFKTIIADESSKLKGYRGRGGGKRAGAFAKIAHLARRYVNLTGTPAPNGLIDLWGQQWFVDGGAALGRTFTAFRDRWFTPIRLGNDLKAVKYIPTTVAKQQIEERMAPTTCTLRVKDWFDIRDPIVVERTFHLPDNVAEIYEKLERELYAQIGDAEIEPSNVAVKTAKLIQVCSGAVYDELQNVHLLHDEKLDILEEIIEERAGAPLMVAYHWKHDRDRIKRRFPHARELDDKPRTIKDWNEGRIELLLMHPEAAGHGLNLQHGGNAICFFTPWWALEAHQQAIERIGPTRQMQSGYDREVYVYRIVAIDTIDGDVYERLDGKADVQTAFMDGMKARQRARRKAA